MKAPLLQALAATLLLALGGCRGPGEGYRSDVADPDERLAHLLDLYESNATHVGNERGPTLVDPGRIQNELERLAFEYPRHVPTLLANAVIAFDARQPEKAQNYLDQVLRVQQIHPDAAMLRARIALDQGNRESARRLLENQVRYTPDHAGLRETLAAVLVFQGETDAAMVQLEQASRLGAPLWRVQYHRGWIEERQGRIEAARTYYEHALELEPSSREVAQRLDGLRAAAGETVR